MRNRPIRLLLAVFLLFLAGIAGLKLVEFGYFIMTPAQPGSTTPIVVEIQKGQRPLEVAKSLGTQGAIKDPKSLVWLGRLTGAWKKMKAGEYQVSPSMTPYEVLRTITSGLSIQHPLTVREGENHFEIAEDLAAKKLASKERFLALTRDPQFIQTLGLPAPVPSSLEGYLYPETYFITKTMSVEDIIRQMVKKFQTVWTPAYQARAKELGMNRHEALTLASMVEKETGAPQERKLISSVFHNRLRKKMRLQSDPTTIYGIWHRYKGNLHKEDLLSVNPFNTYVVPALPAGPIGNPGKEAIDAALYPAESEYLFFVSHNDGTHEFTRSLNDHLQAVRRFQLDPKAREGKSWRDLKKKTSG